MLDNLHIRSIVIKSSSFIGNALIILLLVGKWLQINKHFIIIKDIASEIECNIFAQNCEYRSFSNANTKEVRDNFIYQVINENGANCTFKNYLRHCGICFLSIIRIYCVIKGISLSARLTVSSSKKIYRFSAENMPFKMEWGKLFYFSYIYKY